LRLLGADYSRDCKAIELLRRPELEVSDVAALSAVGAGSWRDGLCDEEVEQVELQLDVRAKYHGYIERQQREIARHARQESLLLPGNIDYATVAGLSNEARQKLTAARPATLGQASRLEGMTPSAVSLVLIHLKKLQSSAPRKPGQTPRTDPYRSAAGARHYGRSRQESAR
jgi:tRNA uridine 5-carboxymethylaminomethyl modification enzyme